MKTKLFNLALIAAIGLVGAPLLSQAQEEKEDLIQYGKVDFIRSYDKTGLHVFETNKDDLKKAYTGRRLSLGAGFTQQFQAITHENPGALNSLGTGVNALHKLTPGFMTAQANLYIDVQLAEGIRLNLTNYLSSRHHNEVWVKGGYLQIDKFPFKGQIWDQLSEIVTVKAGHMEINYGDSHFRRPDGGHTLYSPFMEGNIMDAFATEIAGEVYVMKNGLLGMIGLSNGMIKGHVDSTAITPFDDNTARNPSIYLKGGVDKQVTEDLRLRLTGSVYHNSGTAGSGLTLYSGDRTGSNYQNVMEQGYSAGAKKAYTAMFTSGRFNPGFTGKLDAVMVNGFAKYKGLEFFGTYEYAKGRSRTEADSRVAQQLAVEGVYRFGTNENLFAGVRYNTVNSELRIANQLQDVRVDRFAVAAGWFLTKNILMKGEFVKQNYTDFPAVDFRHNGKFDGVVVEAIIAF